MKKHLSILSVLSITLTAIANPQSSSKLIGQISAPQLQQVEKCLQRPDFLSQTQALNAVQVQSIQHQVLVGKKADFYVEAPNSDGTLSQVHTAQFFKDKKSKSKVICGQAQEAQKTFSIYAPTLLDNSLEKRVGNSFWQFQINAQTNQFASWNRRTQALKGSLSLDKTLASVGAEYKIYQLNEKEVQIVFSKEQDGVMQFLSIQYDLINN